MLTAQWEAPLEKEKEKNENNEGWTSNSIEQRRKFHCFNGNGLCQARPSGSDSLKRSVAVLRKRGCWSRDSICSPGTLIEKPKAQKKTSPRVIWKETDLYLLPLGMAMAKSGPGFRSDLGNGYVA